MKSNGITEYFEEVELYEEYDGYLCSVADVITIVILGSICGLKNVKQIHQWAESYRYLTVLKRKLIVGIKVYLRFIRIVKHPRKSPIEFDLRNH